MAAQCNALRHRCQELRAFDEEALRRSAAKSVSSTYRRHMPVSFDPPIDRHHDGFPSSLPTERPNRSVSGLLRDAISEWEAGLSEWAGSEWEAMTDDLLRGLAARSREGPLQSTPRTATLPHCASDSDCQNAGMFTQPSPAISEVQSPTAQAPMFIRTPSEDGVAVATTSMESRLSNSKCMKSEGVSEWSAPADERTADVRLRLDLGGLPLRSWQVSHTQCLNPHLHHQVTACLLRRASCTPLSCLLSSGRACGM